MVAPLLAAKAHTATLVKAKTAVAVKANVAVKPAITWYKSAIAAGWKKSYRLHKTKLMYKKYLRYSRHYLKWQRHYNAKTRAAYVKRMYWWKRAMKLRWVVKASRKHFYQIKSLFKRRLALLKHYAVRYHNYKLANLKKYRYWVYHARRAAFIARGYAKTAKHFAARKDTLGMARRYYAASKAWMRHVKPRYGKAAYHRKLAVIYGKKSRSMWSAFRVTKARHARYHKTYYSKLAKY